MFHETHTLLRTPDFVGETQYGTVNTDKYGLFNEKYLLQLQQKQLQREDYVRRKLRGEYIPSYKGYSKKGSKSYKIVNSDNSSRIEDLKRQIEEVKQERLRVIAEGERKVKDYMAQLKKEQEEYARETEKLRSEDERLNTQFLEEVSDLDRRLSQNVHSINEIKEHVEKHLSKTHKRNVVVSSIKVNSTKNQPH